MSHALVRSEHFPEASLVVLCRRWTRARARLSSNKEFNRFRRLSRLAPDSVDKSPWLVGGKTKFERERQHPEVLSPV